MRTVGPGFSYRKSVKAGPFRITASKSGISYSAGVKGARVTKRANGRVQTMLSAPGTGLRYTSTSGAKSRQATRRTGSRPTPARRTASAPNISGGLFDKAAELYWYFTARRIKGVRVTRTHKALHI
jgi:hypothetical protein